MDEEFRLAYDGFIDVLTSIIYEANQKNFCARDAIYLVNLGKAIEHKIGETDALIVHNPFDVH